ncbi:hypothetical protein [Tenacibaculum sp. UWU-22]|uniref:hypothetical protein n=1 Tax=Tenacibaculum sp. UWU-22 TaxID=3234187 RepID=UPI0034DB5834
MTTKALIDKVEAGAIYQEKIYDYWVTCYLKNDFKIILFDYELLDITKYINKNVEININSLFVEKGIKKDLRHFQGMIIEQSNEFYFTNDFINIQVSKEDIDNENIELNRVSDFSFGRLDLVGLKELTNDDNA